MSVHGQIALPFRSTKEVELLPQETFTLSSRIQTFLGQEKSRSVKIKQSKKNSSNRISDPEKNKRRNQFSDHQNDALKDKVRSKMIQKPINSDTHYSLRFISENLQKIVQDPNEDYSQNLPEMETAIESGNEVEVKKLFPSLNDKQKQLSFLRCAEKGKNETWKWILDQGVNINSSGPTGKTSLMIAAKQNNIELVRHLILKKCDLEAVDSKNQTALWFACLSQSLELFSFLVQHGANIHSRNASNEMLASFVSRVGSVDIVKFLFSQKGITPNAVETNGNSPLLYSAAIGRLDVVKYFIEELKCDPNQKNLTGCNCLTYAAGNGKVEVSEFLISTCKFDLRNIDNHGKSALHFAAWIGNIEGVKYCISKGLGLHSTSTDGRTPLIHACSEGRLDVVKHLILSGSKLDVTDKYSKTAFSVAIEKNQKDVVEYLLPIVDPKIETFHSVKVGHTEMLKFIHLKGIDFNISNEQGWTPLMYACSHGNLDAVKYLISLKCDPNQADNKFQTCLHIAVKFGKLDIVKYLFSIGCNPIAVDKKKRMPIDLAREKGHNSIVEYLSKIPHQYYNEMRKSTLSAIHELKNQIRKLEDKLKQQEIKFKKEIEKELESKSIELQKHSKIHLQNVEAIQSAANNELQSLRSQHIQYIKNLETSKSAEILEIKNMLNKQISELKSLNLQQQQLHEQQILQLKENHSKELIAFDQRLITEKDEIRKLHAEEMKNANGKNANQIKEILIQNERMLQQGRNSSQHALNQQQLIFKQEYASEIDTYQAEIETLKNQLENERLTKSFQYQKQIEDLEQQLKTEAKKSKAVNILEVDCQNDLPVGITLGTGAYGRVFKSKYSTRDVAVKTVHLEEPIDPVQLPRIEKHFKNELEILTTARHPNIVNVVGVCRNVKHLSLVLELAERGSLHRYLYKNKTEGFKFSDEQTIQILIDISNGMNYLHQFKPQIVHRDLKSANILLFSDWTAKVTDFGISKLKEATSHFKSSTTHHGIGTTAWMAPELLDPEISKTTEKVDVYSFAMVIYEMLNWDEEQKSYLKPWNGKSEAFVINSVSKGYRPLLPMANDTLISLMKKCWAQNPNERPSFSIVMSDLEKMATGVGAFAEWKKSPDLLLIEGWKAIDSTSFRSISIFPLPEVKDPSSIPLCLSLENEKLNRMLKLLHKTDSLKLEQAHVIDNSALQNAFQANIEKLNQPSTVHKQTWRELGGGTFREKLLQNLDEFAEQWTHNQNKGNLQLIPLFHGLQNEKSGLSIAKKGFSTLQTDGYFGSGIYFTSNLEYACQYVKNPTEMAGGKKGYWVMLSWVLVRNVFPVLEFPHYRGKPLEAGYDAHFTFVKPERTSNGVVIPGSFVPVKSNEPDLMKENMTELVVNQEAQCLPMYLLYVTK